MYKEILFYLMLIGSVSRATAIFMLAHFNKINLPVVTVVLSALIAFFGVCLVVKRIIRDIHMWELATYHILADVSVIFNFIVLRFTPMDISMIETVITGSVLSLVVSLTVLSLALRKKHYITLRKLRKAKIPPIHEEPKIEDDSEINQESLK